MADHPGIVIGALSWNLFHGRDFPPDPALFTLPSRLLRREERDASHAQVNRPLLAEFADTLSGLDWDIALLQEAPPRWFRRLCQACGAHGALALTSRNWLPALQWRLADWNPDLVASSEGGSNQLLVRPPARIAETRRLTLARWPERRRMLFCRLELPDGRELCVANMHLSTADPLAKRELMLAAERAVEWAGEAALIFGGDLNLEPRARPAAFAALRDRFGLKRPTAPGAIDHLFGRGLELLEAPTPLPPERREIVRDDGLRIRLSDHTPVAARFGMR